MNSVKWSQNTKDILGLPRPYVDLPLNIRKNPTFKRLIMETKLYLHKKIPVPWQSEPIFDEIKPFILLLKNEESVYVNGICAYCGINFKEDDLCIRWTTLIGTATKEGPNLFSDNYPFHIKCMKQARIFCPRMRQTEDGEYEFGNYETLKNNFMIYFNSINSEEVV
jgi:hypothetical protein